MVLSLRQRQQQQRRQQQQQQQPLSPLQHNKQTRGTRRKMTSSPCRLAVLATLKGTTVFTMGLLLLLLCQYENVVVQGFALQPLGGGPGRHLPITRSSRERRADTQRHHVALQASFFASEQTDPTRLTESLFTQVISDVDDTLKSSGGVNIGGVALGGIDVQYARGDLYPGVESFMLQLSLDNRKDQTLTPPKIAILTARAEEFKAALELKESSSLAQAFLKAGRAEGIEKWGVGPVLYGSVGKCIVGKMHT